MSIASESDEMGNGGGSPDAVDDVNSGGSGGGNTQLKKGPWTSAEDAVLVEYVTKHGEGNWNAVQKHSGLARCGKSCRLRWANHLRPNLKKGLFSPEEEERIIELHAKIGNKWARMASELPGRTDNEIKNYWNTRIKRRQRAGLPVYPPEICPQSQNENDQTNTFSSPSSGNDQQYPILAPTNIFDIPVIEFKNLQYNQYYQPEPLDFHSSFHSYPNRAFVSSAFNPPPNQYQQITQSFMYPSSSLAFDNAVINGNLFPSSETKLELPSFQTQVGNSGPPCSPESVDTLIQNILDENVQPSIVVPQNSGLLDAVIHGSNGVRNSKNGKSSYFDASDMVFGGVENSLSQDFHDPEWENQIASPLCVSSPSVFSEGTTPISGNSFDDLESAETTRGCNVKEPVGNLAPVQYRDGVQTRNEMNFTGQDFMLNSDCFGPINDAVEEFFSDDLSRDFQKPNAAAASSPQNRRVYDDSSAWNSLPDL